MPADSVGLRIACSSETALSTGTVWFDDAIVTRMGTGELLVDGSIDGKIITGALIRSAASGQRVELTSQGLKGYDSAGVVKTSVGTDGLLTAVDAVITGTVKTGTTGQRVEISDTTAKFYSANNALGTIAGVNSGNTGALVLSGGFGSLTIGQLALPRGGSSEVSSGGPVFFPELYTGNGSRVPDTATGTVDNVSVAANGATLTTVTFPTGLFASAPRVMVTGRGIARNIVCYTENVTASGFSLGMGDASPGSFGARTGQNADWVAFL